MFNKRILAIIVIIFGFIILLGLIFFMFLAPVPEEAPEAEEEAAAETVETEEPANLEPALPEKRREIIKKEVNEDDLKRLAGSFAERYGSYSNQSGYENIKDLKIFMSSSMKEWADNFIKEAGGREGDESIYYGLTTKAVVVETKLYSEFSSSAEFLVKTQRREAVGSTANIRTFQQDATVEMIKEKGAWKVDRVIWKE